MVEYGICKCGCGERVAHGKTYVRGHNRRGGIGFFSGRHHTEESRNKLRLANIGKRHTEQTKELLREISTKNKVLLSQKAKLQWENAKLINIPIGMTGRHHSKQSKIKMSQSHIGKHPTEEQNMKNSNSHKGELNHFYGKRHTRESLLKMSRVHKGRRLTEEQKSKISKANKGKTIPLEARVKNSETHKGMFHTDETKIKLRGITIKQWKDSDYRKKQLEYRRGQWQNPEFVIKQMKARGVKPNKTEKYLEDVLSTICPEFKYNGDGRLGVVLAGLVPDYVNTNGSKQVIECFGEYWHRRKSIKWHQTEEGRVETYKTVGWDCLVIWEAELKEIDKVKAKILDFVNPNLGGEI